MHQRASDVGLEQNDRGKDHVADDVSDQPVERFELQAQRNVEEGHDDRDADRHLHRARAADQLQQLVHHDRNDQDVEQVPPVEIWALQQIGEPGHGCNQASGKACRRPVATLPVGPKR